MTVSLADRSIGSTIKKSHEIRLFYCSLRNYSNLITTEKFSYGQEGFRIMCNNVGITCLLSIVFIKKLESELTIFWTLKKSSVTSDFKTTFRQSSLSKLQQYWNYTILLYRIISVIQTIPS